MTAQEHWSVKKFRELRPALGQYTNQLVTEMMEGADGLEGNDLFLLENAIFFAPEPIGLAHIYQRGPYANPEIHKQRLEGACERGWLVNQADGAYGPSQKGREYYEQVAAAYKDRLAEVQSLPEGNLERIADLLARVVQSARESSQVLHKPALELTTKEVLPGDASGLQKIQLYCEQILAFRDDTHVASWSPHQLEGIVWESLSDVWEGTAGTPKEMAEKRPFRGFEAKDYAAAFEALIARGWIAETDGGYDITEEGRQVRERAEELTNQYYDAAWEALEPEDKRELAELFQTLLDTHAPEPVAA